MTTFLRSFRVRWLLAICAVAAIPAGIPGAVPVPVSATLQEPPASRADQPTRPDSTAEPLRERIESLRSDGLVEIEGDTVTGDAIVAFYESRQFRPAWRDARRADAVMAAIRGMESEGLRPSDYHLRTLTELRGRKAATQSDSAWLDIMLTSAVYRLAYDLRFGRVDRTSGNDAWSIGSDAPPVTARTIDNVASSDDVAATLESIVPDHPAYTGMRDALAQYRGIAANGGWPRLPDGPVMRRDSAAGPIALLRRRLAIEGYLDAGSDSGVDRFDAALEDAVRRFQHTHGLNEDGIVGPATRAELNVSVDERINSLRVNMERARWILPYVADRFVAVNIAGQKVYLVDHGQVPFETRAIVGDQYRRTPVFADTMRYIVLNPTWTVPRSINNEILAGIRSDPDYLSNRNIVLIDGDEKRVPADTISFGSYTGANFPWIFRQLAGPANPLGRIKFMFPNKYNVYLHDTPSRAAFEREERTFSHGCIRVEDPFRLAELVLAGQADRATLMSRVESGETETIRLEHPLPVLLLYWTAAADLHGELHFYRDIYDRDETVLNALDGPIGHR